MSVSTDPDLSATATREVAHTSSSTAQIAMAIKRGIGPCRRQTLAHCSKPEQFCAVRKCRCAREEAKENTHDERQIRIGIADARDMTRASQPT
jgi:hypothetical protein